MRAVLGCTLSALFGACAATWLLEARLKASEQRHAATEAIISELQARRLSASERHLGGIYVTDVATAAASGLVWTGVGQGCMGIPVQTTWADSSGTDAAPHKVIDTSLGNACNGQYCPDCFYFFSTSSNGFTRTANNALTALPKLTLQNCHSGKWGSGNAMGLSPITKAVREYLFINQQQHTCLDTGDCGVPIRISDNAATPNSYVLHPQSHVTAYCQAGDVVASGALIFPWNPTKQENGCPIGCSPRAKLTRTNGFERASDPDSSIYSADSATVGAGANTVATATSAPDPEVLDAAWAPMTELIDFYKAIPAAGLFKTYTDDSANVYASTDGTGEAESTTKAFTELKCVHETAQTLGNVKCVVADLV